jgi:hypothetical protein
MYPMLLPLRYMQLALSPASKTCLTTHLAEPEYRGCLDIFLVITQGKNSILFTMYDHDFGIGLHPSRHVRHCKPLPAWPALQSYSSR